MIKDNFAEFMNNTKMFGSQNNVYVTYDNNTRELCYHGKKSKVEQTKFLIKQKIDEQLENTKNITHSITIDSENIAKQLKKMTD